MDELLAQVEQALDHGVAGLRAAIAQADLSLAEVDAPKKPTEFVVGALMSFDDEPKVSTAALRGAWAPVRAHLLAHLETEAKLVLPGIRHVLNGKTALRAGLATPIRRMIVEHAEISDQLELVLNEAAPIARVYDAFDALRRHWDEHVDDQETLIFPETLEADTDVEGPMELQARTISEESYAVEEDDVGLDTLDPERVSAAREEAEPEEHQPSEAELISARLREAASRRQAAAEALENRGLMGRMRSLWQGS